MVMKSESLVEKMMKDMMAPRMYDMPRMTLISLNLAMWMSALKGRSHVYIFIAWMPEMISFVSLTRSSVLMAVFSLNDEDRLPRKPCSGMNIRSVATPMIADSCTSLYMTYITMMVSSGPIHR